MHGMVRCIHVIKYIPTNLWSSFVVVYAICISIYHLLNHFSSRKMKIVPFIMDIFVCVTGTLARCSRASCCATPPTCCGSTSAKLTPSPGWTSSAVATATPTASSTLPLAPTTTLPRSSSSTTSCTGTSCCSAATAASSSPSRRRRTGTCRSGTRKLPVWWGTLRRRSTRSCGPTRTSSSGTWRPRCFVLRTWGWPDLRRSWKTRRLSHSLPRVSVQRPAIRKVHRDHLLLDGLPNLGPLISRWELDKFKNCWNNSFRTSKILTLLYQQFLNLSSSEWDMSGPRLGTLSNNRWSGVSLMSIDFYVNSALFIKMDVSFFWNGKRSIKRIISWLMKECYNMNEIRRLILRR